MSDEFDKEAEREKLREKFARDEKKREHTQRMSELLLKGATMTNKHCEQCGDPIFRHDGREFCPSCNRPASGSDATDETTNATSGPADATSAPADATSAPAGVSRDETGTSTTEAATPEETEVDPSAANGTDAGSTAPRPEDAELGTAGTARGPQRRRPSTPDDGSRRALDDGPVAEPIESRPDADRAADTAAARASLTRTLTRFARAAEETDDPRRAKERLQAAREAAETLASLDR